MVTKDWLDASILDMHQSIDEKKLTIPALIDFYLERIEKFNPTLNAIREINPAAKTLAKVLDEEWRKKGPRSFLHGIPIVIKDNIAATGMTLTAGSRALEGWYPPMDATIVEKLKDAGAIVLGKANMTEFADYVSDTMPSSYSSISGDVNHPYGFSYGRGVGSSVGSACAVAAGLAPVAIGTETQNSIQTPACVSGVVGVKPTVGLVSRFGIVPLVLSQDTAGPITRSIEDAAIVLSILSGMDPKDTYTLTAGSFLEKGFEPVRNIRALMGMRLGIAREVYSTKVDNNILDAVETIKEILKENKAVVIDPTDIPTASVLDSLRSSVFRTEFKVGLNCFLQDFAAPRRSLAEIIAFNESHAADCLAYGQNLLLAAEKTTGLDDPQYQNDRRRDLLLARISGLEAVFTMHRLDALIVPGTAAAKLTGKAGFPVVALPTGYATEGKPLGITLIGRPFDETKLLSIAAALEMALPKRKWPNLTSGV